MKKKRLLPKTLATLALTLSYMLLLTGSLPPDSIIPDAPVIETTEEEIEPSIQPLDDTEPKETKKE